MKKISIITPCYNSNKFIEDCVNSVQKSINLNQFEFEHIIIDDNSKDNTLEILKNFKFKNLRIIEHSQNKGSSEARNAGIENSDADYLYFLDHDDVILQNTLRYLFEKLENEKNNWIYGDFLRTDFNLSYEIGNDYYGWNFSSPQDLLSSMYCGVHFFQHNFLVSRKLLLKIGGYDKTILIPQDFDLITRILLENEMPSYLPWPTHLHRFHDSNLTPKHYHDDYKSHRSDVNSLYLKYKDQMANLLSQKQIESIESYLEAH